MTSKKTLILITFSIVFINLILCVTALSNIAASSSPISIGNSQLEIKANSNLLLADDKKPYTLPIIMYHSINTINNNAYCLHPTALEKDLKYLNSKGYQAVFMSDIIDFVKNNGKLPPKAIVITFDDGFYNNYVYAYPLIKKYNQKAVISIVGTFTERAENEKHRSKHYSNLLWSEISEMSQSGYIEIQNHTYDMHSIKNGRRGCGKKSNESVEAYSSVLKKDLAKNNYLLKEKCDITTNTLAFPYGHYSKEALPTLKILGIQAGLTCNEGLNYLTKNCDIMQLKRFNRPSYISSEQFFKNTVKLP